MGQAVDEQLGIDKNDCILHKNTFAKKGGNIRHISDDVQV